MTNDPTEAPDTMANALVTMLGQQAAQIVQAHGVPPGTVARGYLGTAIVLFLEAHPGLGSVQAAADWLHSAADELAAGDAERHQPKH